MGLSQITRDFRSERLAKALVNANAQQAQWVALGTQVTSPAAVGDGVYNAGADSNVSPGRLFLMPYAEGGVGSQFSLRVYAWRDFFLPTGDPATQVWIPHLLAEFACTTCNQGGPVTQEITSSALLKPSEFLCDTISLTQGSLGVDGFVTSTGPGTNLVAFALLDLTACRRFQFDFQWADTSNNIGMNCLWARA